MKRALFITIGTRDIEIDKSKFKEIIDPEEVKKVYRKNKAGIEQMLPRKAGQLIKSKLQGFKKSLEFPIINPFLDHLRKNDFPDFDNVFLVATNQKEEDARDFHDLDTIYFAEILKQILPDIYKKQGKQKIGKIDILQVRENVVFIDNMFKYFNDLFKGRQFESFNSLDEVHILNQGGIDAINYGLLINALYIFGDKVKLYNVNEKNKLCTPLDFGIQFGLEQEKLRIRTALNRYDYSYIKNSNIGGDLSSWATYAEARLNFDFDTADKNLNNIGIANRNKQIAEREDISKIKNNTESLTQELFWNAWIKYQQESYVDFVQRFFRIVEQYAQQKALSYLKDFNYNPKTDHTRWHERINQYLDKLENNELREFLENTFLDSGQKLELKTPNIPVFMNILKFFNPREYEFIYKIEPLSKIRNKGIGAHGFDPISLAVILDKTAMTKKQFEKMLEKLRRKLKVAANPFERINRYIEEAIN
jgi:hypothetical protein